MVFLGVDEGIQGVRSVLEWFLLGPSRIYHCLVFG